MKKATTTPSKKAGTKTKKAPTKSKKKVEMVDKSTQFNDKEVKLEHIKHQIDEAVKVWMNESQNLVKTTDIKEDDHDAYLNMVEELNQHLKNIMNDDELSLRLVKQAHLELEASMTFTMAASYLSSGGFHGFANFFFKLSNVTMKLVFTIGTMTDLSMMKPIQHPDWRSWENAVDAVNAAFRSERATINGYTFLNNILPEDMKLILGEKKDSITNLFEKIMSQLKDAEEPEDFYAVDQNLLSEKKTKK